MKRLSFFIIIILLFNSCASIFNGRKTIVKISSDTQSKIIYQQDTISINKEEIYIRPIRSKNPLKITVLKDNLIEKFNLDRKVSSLLWLNLFYNYGLGILVDLTNNKRFTYKHNLHFITDSISSKIILSNKKITLIPKNKVFIYTSPLQTLTI